MRHEQEINFAIQMLEFEKLNFPVVKTWWASVESKCESFASGFSVVYLNLNQNALREPFLQRPV